ncbi:MAG: HD domain-containing protein [Bacilli bacterium]|nr:HD domain-containing protein [Bacilli bacterium]
MSYTYNKNKSITVNDPIYGKITVPYPFSQIVLTKEMMRLSEISQNGFSSLEYKELENNNRLNHSIGAFHIMTLFLNKLEDILKKYNITLSQDDKDVALCSMLLHDIGHGPFSHSLEQITNYSHEKRTTDILLGDTQINEVITNFFGKEKVKKIASFISEINDKEKPKKDSFTKLLNNLVSYQLDADRLDYLLRDSHYIKMKSAIDLDKIISSINVIVNNNQEYELLIDRKGLASIENVLIQRYQMYRDVYLSPTSVLGDWLFNKIIDRYYNNPSLHQIPVSQSFKNLAFNPQITNLNDFLNMKDEDFKESFEIIKEYNIDPILTYLCNFNISDFIIIKNDVSTEKIKNKIREIFGNIDIENTLSIVSFETNKLIYNKNQKLNIQDGNKIMDLTQSTNLIKPQETLNHKLTFFNPKLLMLELGLNKHEEKKYENEVNKMIEDLNKSPEEFELKYIINEKNNNEELLNQLLSVFIKNGFKIISIREKENNDEYYDSKNLDLYKNGASLRIRKITEGKNKKIKATCKIPLATGEVYSSRNEFEDTLSDDNFESLKQKMTELKVPLDFNIILDYPLINSNNKRTDIILNKNGIEVCLSFDNTTYTNHLLNETFAFDSMIEIEAIGKPNNRIILNEIHNFISYYFPFLQINKQNKYERGINSTIEKYNNELNSQKLTLSKQ